MPSGLKAAFHDTDIDSDIIARILADASDTRDFPKLFLRQAERGSRPTRRHPRDDPRDDGGEDVECGLNQPERTGGGGTGGGGHREDAADGRRDRGSRRRRAAPGDDRLVESLQQAVHRRITDDVCVHSA